MPVDDPTDVEGGLISKHDLLQISIFNINLQEHVTGELMENRYGIMEWKLRILGE